MGFVAAKNLNIYKYFFLVIKNCTIENKRSDTYTEWGVRRGSLRELKGRGRKCQSVYVGGEVKLV